MTSPRIDRPIVVFAAGSLRGAFNELIDAFQRGAGAPVEAEYGPAGLLRERIEGGAAFDLFASANMEHPQRLAAIGLVGPVVCFARNRLCIIARRDFNVTAETFLDVALRPDVTLGTSTPGADPSGDYALEFFARLDELEPGVGRFLAANARRLVGGPKSPAVPAGLSAAGWMIAQGKADMFISYATNGQLVASDPTLTVCQLPDTLTPIAEYGMAIRVDAQKGTSSLGAFILSKTAQAILARYGFLRSSAALDI